MILSGHGIFGAAFSFFVVETLFTLISLFLIASQIGFSFPRFSGMKTWLRYGAPLIPTGISLWVISFSDRYVISYLLGISSVGVYSAAYAIGFSFFAVMEFINFVLVPTVSKLYDERKIQDVKNYLSYVLRFYLLLAIPAVVGLSIFSKQILAIVTTPAIAEAAWMITPIIATCTLFAGVQEVYDKTLRLTKKTTRIGLVVTITAVINLSLNFLLIPIFGILGAAVATLVAYGLSAGLMTFFAVKEFSFKVEKKVILKFVFASIIMAAIGLLLYSIMLVSLMLCILVCIFIYFLILFLLGVFSPREIKFILESFRFKD
jgi:O-antigen/teichoic acid export membrane protein